MDILPEKKKV